MKTGAAMAQRFWLRPRDPKLDRADDPTFDCEVPSVVRVRFSQSTVRNNIGSANSVTGFGRGGAL